MFVLLDFADYGGYFAAKNEPDTKFHGAGV